VASHNGDHDLKKPHSIPRRYGPTVIFVDGL
jgi:hypothetical protein